MGRTKNTTKTKRTLYAAYGSNMNLPQMAARCPTAKVVGTGILNGYELLFRGQRVSAVATVEPQEGSKVPVLVWEIMPSDEAALDRYEGYPFLYRKETLKVQMGKKTVEVMIYIMNDGRPVGLPSRYYYNTIRDGYLSANIPLDALRGAVDKTLEGGYGTENAVQKMAE